MPFKKKLPDDAAKLTEAINQLYDRMDVLAAHFSPARFLWMGFLRGIVYGLGILVAFALVVPILLAVLSSFDWVPIIGDILTEIIARIEATRTGAGF